MHKMITRPDGTPIAEIDEEHYLADMENKCWGFFKTPHGKRETYTVYRGQLIVRNTMQFTGEKPTRMTAVHLYFPNGYADNPGHADLFCISAGSGVGTVRQAEKLIDRVLDGGIYHYGI